MAEKWHNSLSLQELETLDKLFIKFANSFLMADCHTDCDGCELENLCDSIEEVANYIHYEYRFLKRK